MVSGFMYIFSFSLLVALIMLFPRTTKKAMFLTELSIAVVTVMCYAVLAAQVFSVAGIPVNLKSISIAYSVLNALILFMLAKKRKIQSLCIDWFQIVSVIVLSVIFWVVESRTFSHELRPVFVGSRDASLHFGMAMEVVRSQTVGRMPFAPFHNAMVIEIVGFLCPWCRDYQAFILSDAMHYYFELIFFYSLTLEFSNKRSTKYAAPVITLLYWWGYPLYSYIIGNFVYWGWGVILCAYVVFGVNRLQRHKGQYVQYAEIVLGAVGVMSCYILFIPPMLLGAAFWLYPQIKNIVGRNKKRLIVLAGGTFAVLIMFLYFLLGFFGNSVKAILDSVNLDGVIYTNIGTDFLLTLPIVLGMLIALLKKKRLPAFFVFLLSVAGYTMVMFVLALLNIMSRYYYYKHYYLIWMFWWLAIVNGMDIIEITEETLQYAKAYICMLVMVYATCFTRLDKWISQRMGAGIFGTDLYAYNFSFLDTDYGEYDMTKKMDVYEAAKKEAGDKGGTAVFLYYNNRPSAAFWYQAVTGQQAVDWEEHFPDGTWRQMIINEDCDYLVVMKEIWLYESDPDFFRQYEWVFENEEGFVIKK